MLVIRPVNIGVRVVGLPATTRIERAGAPPSTRSRSKPAMFTMM